MIYIIYGDQAYRIKSHIKHIAKEVLKEIDNLNYVKLDYLESSFREIIDEASLVALGYDHKVVVVDNATFLAKETKSLKNDKEYLEFISLIKSLDESITLILALNDTSIDIKNEIYNYVDSNGKILSLLPVKDEEWVTYVNNQVNKYQLNIARDALYELAKRTAGDVGLFKNTLDKLLIYGEPISMKELNLLVDKPLEDNVFLIYNNLISKHTDMALRVYHDLVDQNVEPIRIISTLGNQFRLLLEIKYLVSIRKSNKEIAEILAIKESRAGVIARQCFNIDEYRIRNALENLYQLDLQIKSGLVDRYYALELFLIKFNE